MYYLHLKESDVFFNRIRVYARESDGVWLTRPMTPKILYAVCKNVMHLYRLRCVLMERMVAGMGLYAGINYYIGSQQELSNEAYKGLVANNNSSSTDVPAGLIRRLKRGRWNFIAGSDRNAAFVENGNNTRRHLIRSADHQQQVKITATTWTVTYQHVLHLLHFDKQGWVNYSSLATCGGVRSVFLDISISLWPLWGLWHSQIKIMYLRINIMLNTTTV